MQHQIHPDDERLAALAGGDPDVSADAGLHAHVAACDRCGPMVAELQQLSSALAELPDLVPSRPLQLVPPVPAASDRAGSGWPRRLAAPMMAAGVVLVLVATIGGSGALTALPTSFGGAGAAAPSAASTDAEGEATDVRDRPIAFPLNLFFKLAPARDQAAPPELSGGAQSQRPGPDDNGSKASESPTLSPQPAGKPLVSEQPVLSVNPWGVILLIGAVAVLVGGVLLLTQPGRGP